MNAKDGFMFTLGAFGVVIALLCFIVTLYPNKFDFASLTSLLLTIIISFFSVMFVLLMKCPRTEEMK